MANQIQLLIGDRSYAYRNGISLQEVADEMSSYYPHDIIIAKVDGRLTELHHKLYKDAKVELITTADSVGMEVYRRTATMIMLKAFEDVVGKEKIDRLSVEYSLGRGYYCELESETVLDEALLCEIKKRMEDIVLDAIEIEKYELKLHEALELFKKHHMEDKVNVFKYRRSSYVNIYKLDHTLDYNYGYMATNTSLIKYFDLHLFDEGFVLQLPTAKNPEKIEPFAPSRKLFAALKETDRWGELLKIRTIGDLNNVISEGKFFELVLVQEALQEKKIADIAKSITDGGKRIVLIAGPSSSGKTSFSHRLSVQLRANGLKPHPIPVDNYFVDREKTPLDEDGNYDFECLGALDLDRFNSDMTGLLEGKEVELPVFNFVTGKREASGPKMQIGPKDVLVIEGIHSLNDAMTYALPDDQKFKIYISALTCLNLDDHNRISTSDGRLLRRICRDASHRGASALRTLSMWHSVRRGEEDNIFPYQEACDAMFNSTLIYELAVLKQYAEPLLFSVSPDAPEYTEAKRLLKFLNYVLGVTTEQIPHNSILREFVGGSCFDVG